MSSNNKVRFFDPGKAYLALKSELEPEIDRVLRAGDLILRNDVDEFEKNLAEYLRVKYVVGVASGSDALMLTMKALGISRDDEVICPSYTFRATIEAICMVGATPVLTDLGDDWVPYATPRTRAVIPAHIAGETLDWEPISGIHMIEDSCQAIGAKSLTGVAACYSFYPAKILGGFGDGGAIATDDIRLYRELKGMRNHYKDSWNSFGWNSRLDNIQAALLNVKLRHLPENIWRRKMIASTYDKRLPSVITRPNNRNLYQDYIVEFRSGSECDSMHAFLADAAIETMKNGYPFPKATPKGPKTLDYEARSLRLPCNEVLTDAEVDRVIEKMHEYYN